MTQCKVVENLMGFTHRIALNYIALSPEDYRKHRDALEMREGQNGCLQKELKEPESIVLVIN